MDTIRISSLNAFPDGKTGLVYVLKADELYKIGHSIDIKSRKRSLRITDAELIYSIETNNAHALEHSLHAKFDDKRTNNPRYPSGSSEWFKLDESDIDFIKTNYAQAKKTRAEFTPRYTISEHGIPLTCRLGKNGRIRIPPNLRNCYGFNEGDTLSITINKNYSQEASR